MSGGVDAGTYTGPIWRPSARLGASATRPSVEEAVAVAFMKSEASALYSSPSVVMAPSALAVEKSRDAFAISDLSDEAIAAKKWP